MTATTAQPAAPAKPKRSRTNSRASAGQAAITTALHSTLSIDERAVVARAMEIIESKMGGEGVMLSDPGAAEAMFKLRIGASERELFDVAFLTTRHRIIAVETMFAGTIDGSEVHPREIAKRALQLNASAILVAHNHPSGNPEPSNADRAVTQRLRQALELIDVRLLDHIIIGRGNCVSLACRGWL